MSQSTQDKQNKNKNNNLTDLALSYARTLSWLSLLLILTISLVLSVFISNIVRENLLTKQQEFANLVASNLNYQIYRRFMLPTVLAYGRVTLRNAAQYERLDEIVRSVIHGLEMQRLRLYDFSRIVSYSTDNEDLGRTGLAPLAVGEALKGEMPKPEIISTFPMWQAPFRLPLEPGSFVLRTIYPLTGEVRNNQGEIHTPVMGVLELSQDITEDYESVLAFQGLIVGVSLLSSMFLFSLLLVLIRRAERVLAERMAKNKALEDELHSSEKLVSMGRVIASIAHEIRNPLGIIRSSSEYLQRRTDQTDDSTKRILGAIYDESCRLSQTVNDFLDYARPRNPGKDHIDISLVVDQALAFLEGEFKRVQLTVNKNLCPNVFTLGDKDLLYRAFYNILVNAQQAMNGTGTITISCECTEDTLIISFSDTGPGFNAEFMDNIFDPFFTTKESGTGLGLAIVKTIIDSHSGQIFLENSNDGGAIVKVELPLAKLPKSS